jgi:hypothetical protein
LLVCFSVATPLPDHATPYLYEEPHFEQTYYAAFDEPKFYAEAMRSSDADKWREAMDEEIAGFWRNGAWELVDINPIWNILTAKWVFKRKRDTDNIIQRFRARLVARGFQQRDGIDYGEIFSPVVRYTTLRMLLALCAHYGLFKRHLDCPKAFTQADLDTPCYMKAPAGMKIPHGKCLKLLKSIYGLKQASRLFNELVSSFLVSQGFTQCTTDTCLYFKMSDANIAIIGVYVDDILLCATTSAYADYLVGLMTVKFNVNDLGEITWCLGMRITTSEDRHCIQLDLERYILNKITEYNFDNLSPLPTPMVHDIKLTDKDCPYH